MASLVHSLRHCGTDLPYRKRISQTETTETTHLYFPATSWKWHSSELHNCPLWPVSSLRRSRDVTTDIYIFLYFKFYFFFIYSSNLFIIVSHIFILYIYLFIYLFIYLLSSAIRHPPSAIRHPSSATVRFPFPDFPQPRTQACSRYPSDQRRLGTECDSARLPRRNEADFPRFKLFSLPVIYGNSRARPHQRHMQWRNYNFGW